MTTAQLWSQAPSNPTQFAAKQQNDNCSDICQIVLFDKSLCNSPGPYQSALWKGVWSLERQFLGPQSEMWSELAVHKMPSMYGRIL